MQERKNIKQHSIHTHTHTKLITTDVRSLACNTNLHIALQKDMLLISFYFNIAHYRIH